MGSGVENLTTHGLTAWLAGADRDTRAVAWAHLVAAVGEEEASRRWLAAFAAVDAAET